MPRATLMRAGRLALAALALVLVAAVGLATVVYRSSERYLADVQLEPGFTAPGPIDEALAERGRRQ